MHLGMRPVGAHKTAFSAGCASSLGFPRAPGETRRLNPVKPGETTGFHRVPPLGSTFGFHRFPRVSPGLP
eukprot:gene2512-180_t